MSVLLKFLVTVKVLLLSTEKSLLITYKLQYMCANHIVKSFGHCIHFGCG